MVRFFGFSVFWIWGLAGFSGFLKFSLWFSVFVNNEGGFSDYFSSAFYGFSGFATEVRQVTPRSRGKTGQSFQGTIYSVVPFLLEECMTSLVYLAAVICFVT